MSTTWAQYGSTKLMGGWDGDEAIFSLAKKSLLRTGKESGVILSDAESPCTRKILARDPCLWGHSKSKTPIGIFTVSPRRYTSKNERNDHGICTDDRVKIWDWMNGSTVETKALKHPRTIRKEDPFPVQTSNMRYWSSEESPPARNLHDTHG